MTAATERRPIDHLAVDRSTARRIRQRVLWLMLVVNLVANPVIVVYAIKTIKAAQTVAGRPIPTVEYDPRAEAAAYAAQCAAAWFSFDSGAPRETRDEQVSRCAAPGVDGDWSGEGSQTVVATTVAGVYPASDQTTVVDVDLTVVREAGTVRRRVRLPIVAVDGKLAVSAPPSYHPIADKLDTVIPANPVDNDTVVTSQVESALEGFFAAWAEGSEAELAYYTLDIEPLDGLDGAVAFDGLEEVAVSPPVQGDPNKRVATATVAYRDGRLRTVQAYSVAVTQADGRWYVDAVDAALPPADIQPDQQEEK